MTITVDLQTRIAASARDRQLFSPGDTLIVGLSGGADSVALLDLLASLPDYSLRLTAAHLNHCLRGAESDGDEQFCREFAARLGIPFETRRVDVAAFAAREGLNLEDAGREARIEFLDQLARAAGASAVVLAHHADDQAETVLMRLLRGSGSHGLAGIAWRNRRGYVRPLLNVSRQEIEAYLRERGLEWREDSSNRDTTLLRNRIRHEILPLLESCNPATREALTATASILNDEDALLEELTERAFAELCESSAAGSSCSVARFLSQPPALARRLVRLMYSRHAHSRRLLTSSHVEAVRAMAASPRPNQRLNLPGAIVAVREYDRLSLTRPDAPPDCPYEIQIDGPGSFLLPDGSRIHVEEGAPPLAPKTECSDRAWFDQAQAPYPWTVRTFRPGDRLQPLGMVGTKKVKDIFIDKKIPPSRRAATPLFFSDNRLFWLAGICTSHPSRINDRTTRVVTVTILPADRR